MKLDHDWHGPKPPGTKTCNVCGVAKPLDQFYHNARNRDGYENRCKDCARKQSGNRQVRRGKQLARFVRDMETVRRG